MHSPKTMITISFSSFLPLVPLRTISRIPWISNCTDGYLMRAYSAYSPRQRLRIPGSPAANVMASLSALMWLLAERRRTNPLACDKNRVRTIYAPESAGPSGKMRPRARILFVPFVPLSCLPLSISLFFSHIYIHMYLLFFFLCTSFFLILYLLALLCAHSAIRCYRLAAQLLWTAGVNKCAFRLLTRES